MSNLWFFRLKRAEQQRRRSSGEQSVGSASVQSASGCCSATGSLPNSSSGLLLGHAAGAAATQDGARSQQQSPKNQSFKQQQHQQQVAGTRRARRNHDDQEEGDPESATHQDEQQASLAGRSSLPSAADEAAEFYRTSASARSSLLSQDLAWFASPCRPEVGHSMGPEVASSSGRQQPQISMTNFCAPTGQAGQQLRNGASSAASSATSNATTIVNAQGQQARQQGPPRSHQHPPVTIIRSDSTSTSFIARGWHETTTPASCESPPPLLENCGRRQFVSELAPSGAVAARCLGEPPTSADVDNRRWRPVEAQASVEENAGGQQQQPPASPPPLPLDRHQRAFMLHNHLSSGKVPPIQRQRAGRRSLLEPSGSQRPSKGSFSSVAGLQAADSLDNLASLIPRIRVEFYNSENTLKERLQFYFIKDHTISLWLRTAKLILKILACYLYVCRVILDRGPAYANCYGCQPVNAAQANNVTLAPATGQHHIPGVGQPSGAQLAEPGQAQLLASLQQQQQLQLGAAAASSSSKFDSHPYDGPINFRALFWVDRGPGIWALQTSIATICFLEATLMQYLTFKNNIFSIVSFHFTLEIITNLPFILSIFWKELRTLFVAGFLNCWLAKQCLEAMLNDISIVRQTSVFSHRLTILSATVFCLIFTSACGFQHTQRSGGRNFISIFESIYFVVVTFSTVGYGDFKPETWPSQLFIMVMICVALIVLPTQFEQLAYFWIERKKLGASYAHHSTRHEKHVVVCSTTLRADTIMDFLNEFYAHPLLQTFSVVLLSPCELDTTMKLVLQTPTWNNRVVYIQGSALKANDLIRARMQSAEACFILAARNYNDRSAADEHTILRSWAIRDFSPYVPQYVQIFRTENKIHVAFAEHVVCDEEFKYALLANNCLIPGTSTLVTLLLHTSQQQRQRRGGQASRRARAKRRRKRIRACCSNLLGALANTLKRPFGRASGQQAAAAAGDDCDLLEAQARSSGKATANEQNDDDWRSKINLNTGGPKDELELEAERSARAAAKAAASQADNSVKKQADISSGDDDDDDQSDDDEVDGCRAPEWKRLYGKCSANEIYHIRLSDSRFFGEYQGKSFTYASFHSHRKFGVALVGVQTDMRGTWPIMLNPGPTYVLKPSDILFYINITKEENSALMPVLQTANAFASSCAPPPSVSVNDASQADATQQATQGNPNQPDQLGQASPASTYIRIESASPTGALNSNEQARGDLLEAELKLVMPQRHSVADGAGIVARSLCSVAGLPLANLERLIPLAPSDLPQRQIDDELDAQRRLFAKRDSSASTSAAFGPGSGATGSGSSNNRASEQRRRFGSSVAANEDGGGGGGNNLLAASGYTSRNASTLELAAIATGLRKGSNISISSTKSRDASPTRLKQVVSGLAVKMKRVKLGKSLTHLTLPRMDLGGGGSSTSSTESFVNARGRRPSIAPVPAMMGESEEQDSDHEREQESYFSMSWQSSSESSPIVKKFVFCTTYVGVSPTLCYLLQRKKPPCCLQLVQACDHCPFKNARQYNWPNRCIILASDFASNGIYNFLVPLRAHFHNPNELRPIVLLLERKPSPQFIDAISWFPMVYWMPGSIDNLDDLIKAGINLAHSVVVTNKEATNSAEEDYLADCNTIVAVQTMFKMFPQVGIITELSQSSNMRFMQFRAHDLLLGGLALANYHQQQPSQQTRSSGVAITCESTGGLEASAANAAAAAAVAAAERQSQQSANSNALRDRIQLRKLHSQYFNKTTNKELNSHAYKYRLPFAAGNVFSASMLDTLLYQAFVKDYMITMVRLLLGIDQAPGSGFLSSMRITKEELWIRTYGRLYQRLCSTTCEIPLGIYRTEPLERNSATFNPTSAPASRPGGNFMGAASCAGLGGSGSGQRSSFSFGAFVSQQASYEQATEELERIEISNMVKNRLQDLGMNVADYDDSMTNRNNTFSYVIINPNCDVPLREGDIIYLIRPSPIHSRKLFMHRANSVRYVDQSQHQTPPQAPHTTQTTTTSSGHSYKQQQTSQAGPRQGVVETQGSGRQTGQQQQQADSSQGGPLKSYFSDGDFSEVLIKINDHDDQLQQQQQPQQQHTPSPDANGEHQSAGELVKRRRSSCSDAADSKRSSLTSHELAYQS